MPASNPQGEMQFWDKGAPFLGVENSGKDGGQMQFWIKGQPYPYLFPPSAPSSLIKTIDTIAIAGVKTIMGVAIAGVKTRDTVANS